MTEAQHAPPRAPVKRAFLAGFALHSIALAWLWSRYGEGARGGLLVWMDLPWSIGYLGSKGSTLLAWSFAVGGAWWGFLGALFARALGALVHGTRPAGR